MKKGFTLSEVLITLGIIGIVAVITIPNVMKNYRTRLYTAQIEKTYALLSDAVQTAMNDEHTDDFYETQYGKRPSSYYDNYNEGIGLFLTKYIKTIKKNCKSDKKDACFSTSDSVSYKDLLGNSYTNDSTDHRRFLSGRCHATVQTSSGAAICATYDGKIYDTDNSPRCIHLLVDTNGMAQPNTAGRDIFSLTIRRDGTIISHGECQNTYDDGTPNIGEALGCGKSHSSLPRSAGECLKQVINAGWKMEY